MKTVKIYDITETDILAFESKQFYERCQVNQINLSNINDFDPVGEVLVKKSSLPIKQYNWSNGKRLHAAMSDELREIIGIEVEEMELLKCQVKYEKKEKEFHQELEWKYLNKLDIFESMSFWQRLKWAFKGE